MPVTGNSKPERVARWELIERALAPLIEELPHLKDSHAELQRMIGEARDMESRFEQLRANWLEVSLRRKTLLANGDELRKRLAAALMFHHGFKSEKLAEFGVRPRRDRGKGKKKEPQPPEATPPPTVNAPLPTKAVEAGAGGAKQQG